MADLSFDANIHVLGNGKTERWVMDTSTGQTIYKGQPVILSAADTVNVRGWVDATVVATTDVCVGIAAEKKTVATGDPETTEIEVYTFPSIVGFLDATRTNADMGKKVYMSDSATLSLTAAQNPYLGKIFKVEDGYCYVKLYTPLICVDAT